jgi:hypothetical protein
VVIPCDFLTHNGVLCIYKIGEDSEGNVIYIPSPLCNFDARILLAMYNIDGTIEYKIRASLPRPNGVVVRDIVISAGEFLAMK